MEERSNAWIIPSVSFRKHHTNKEEHKGNTYSARKNKQMNYCFYTSFRKSLKIEKKKYEDCTYYTKELTHDLSIPNVLEDKWK